MRREPARGAGADRLCQLAGALRDQGRWLGRTAAEAGECLALLNEALAILRPLAAAGVMDARMALARTQCALATLLGERGRAVEAIAPGRQAVAMQRELQRS